MRGSVCALVVALSAAVGSAARASAPAEPVVEVFTRAGCPHCVDAERFLVQLQRERPSVRVIAHDVGRDTEAHARLRELLVRHGMTRVGVPAFLVGDELIVGFQIGTTERRIRARVDGWTADGEGEAVETTLFGTLSAHRLGLPLFTVALGLIDGFNPCAMWVLLFVLALLVNLHDRRRMALVGGTFVAVSGLAYFAFMAAWLNVFLIVGYVRAVEVALGAVALAIGAVNVKDFVASGDGPSLRIPAAAKPGLYARVRRVVQAESLAAALAGAGVLAVLVNAIELVCTAGLPVLYTRVLTSRALPTWQYYGYLLLYDAAYMADDAAMLTVAVVTLGRRKLQEREGRWLKLVSGIVMLVLGAMLVAGRVE
jgi:glutaredoxin